MALMAPTLQFSTELSNLANGQKRRGQCLRFLFTKEFSQYMLLLHLPVHMGG